MDISQPVVMMLTSQKQTNMILPPIKYRLYFLESRSAIASFHQQWETLRAQHPLSWSCHQDVKNKVRPAVIPLQVLSLTEQLMLFPGRSQTAEGKSSLPASSQLFIVRDQTQTAVHFPSISWPTCVTSVKPLFTPPFNSWPTYVTGVKLLMAFDPAPNRCWYYYSDWQKICRKDYKEQTWQSVAGKRTSLHSISSPKFFKI